MFPSMPYLEWIEGRSTAATHDLGSSDLRTYRMGGEVVPEPLAEFAQPDDPPPLEASVAAEYGVDESQVLVTAGATHANFLAVATALSLATDEMDDWGLSHAIAAATDETDDSDDEVSTLASRHVLIEKPGYGPLRHTPVGLGADVDRFLRPPEDDYALDPDRVAAACREGTVLATVTNRHNPSGHLADRETLAATAEAVDDAGVHLLVDEVYGPYVTEEDSENVEGRAFGGVTAAGLPSTVVTGSLTKFHGLGGLKVGWLVGPEAFVDRARTVFTHVPAVAAPSVALGQRFFAHRDELVARSRDLLRRNHALLADFVADRDDLQGTVHDGCSFAFLSHESADGDTVAQAAWEEGVLVIPGRFFDDEAGFRLSAGRDTEEVREGLAVLGEVLDDL